MSKGLFWPRSSAQEYFVRSVAMKRIAQTLKQIDSIETALWKIIERVQETRRACISDEEEMSCTLSERLAMLDYRHAAMVLAEACDDLMAGNRKLLEICKAKADAKLSARAAEIIANTPAFVASHHVNADVRAICPRCHAALLLCREAMGRIVQCTACHHWIEADLAACPSANDHLLAGPHANAHPDDERETVPS